MNLHRRHLNESQRATIAAKLATKTAEETRKRGGQSPAGLIRPAGMSNQEAADLLNVGRTSVVAAKKVLKEGTPEEIAAVKSGKASVQTVYREIRKGASPEKREKKRDESLSEAGKNPERIQRLQMQAEIWARLSVFVKKPTIHCLLRMRFGFVRPGKNEYDVGAGSKAPS